ncbi:MAG TPA: sulfotransferase [Rugosimonospora sp.]|nr:sulfotransferase [Rugosimonospora sp.]
MGRASGTRVVYVLGRGRSGSTVFAQALGAVDGFFYAGEVRYLWDPVLTHGSRCACGAAPADCPVWSKVLAAVSWVDRAAVVRWQREVVRESALPRLLRTGGSWPALARYRQVMSRVYAAIADVTGCATVVDSSKRPSYALVVRRLARCDPYFVQLVRDPRASAYSWRSRRYAGGAGQQLRPHGALNATLRWGVLNLGAEVVRHTGDPDRSLLLRYEDFTAAPRETVSRVARLSGAAPAASPFLDGCTVQVGDSHAIAGNPARYRTGALVIREDGRWRRGQHPVDRAVATAVALPLLRRYGYCLR